MKVVVSCFQIMLLLFPLPNSTQFVRLMFYWKYKLGKRFQRSTTYATQDKNAMSVPENTAKHNTARHKSRTCLSSPFCQFRLSNHLPHSPTFWVKVFEGSKWCDQKKN